MRVIQPPTVAAFALAAIGLGLLVMVFRNAGNFLVVDNRVKSDAILITQGDSLDDSYWMGLRLLTNGYGRELLLDARSNRTFFGRGQADWAGDFIARTAANLPEQVRVCPISADTTAEEVYEAGNCLKGHLIRSVLLVVADYHTRRSLAMFSRLLPNYHWSIAAVQDPYEVRRVLVAKARMDPYRDRRVAALAVVGNDRPLAVCATNLAKLNIAS
jgi:uncharacterized SAM-binding protein YcdF (DUF218 family)